MMRFGLSSKIFAISSVVLVMSLFIVVIMSRYIGRAGDEVRVRSGNGLSDFFFAD